MNIFYLDRDPKIASKYHCDKHVVKMILETTQILSTVHHRYESPKAVYKETHKNHPSVLWAGDSHDHYKWLQRLGVELCREYSARYSNRTHKCLGYLEGDLKIPPENIPRIGFIDPPMCMNEECKTPDDTVQAYKNYYRMVKKDLAVWKYTDRPSFMDVT